MALKRISPDEARDLLESGEDYIYLDVRSIPEFEQGHAPGAKNIPLLHRTAMGMQPNGEFVDVCERALGRDAKIITACLKGGRSMRAAQLLQANGFTNVVDMRGGFDGESNPMGQIVYDGWARRGLPGTTEAADDETYSGLSKR
ncbi:MAG: rhodanese-like domain-containing protein [Acidobacteriia bacterium]|nr:rhodanese-like domain-containing protein [Terriglobia bacterium]